MYIRAAGHSTHLRGNWLLCLAVPALAPAAGLGEVHGVEDLAVEVADGLKLEVGARGVDARVAPPQVQQLKALRAPPQVGTGAIRSRSRRMSLRAQRAARRERYEQEEHAAGAHRGQALVHVKAEARAGVADDEVQRRVRDAVRAVALALVLKDGARALVAVVVAVQREVDTILAQEALEGAAQLARHGLVAGDGGVVDAVDVHRPMARENEPRRAAAVHGRERRLDVAVLRRAFVEFVLCGVDDEVHGPVLKVVPAQRACPRWTPLSMLLDAHRGRRRRRQCEPWAHQGWSWAGVGMRKRRS